MRARRISEHSLTGNAADLIAMTRPQFQLVPEADGTYTLVREFPPDEAIESLTARVRPLILNDDPIYFRKVLNAMGYLLKETPRTDVQRLKALWAQFDGGTRSTEMYSLRVGDPSTGEFSSLTDAELAHAWIYGDTVHADEQQVNAGRDFGIAQRFAAAVPMVATVALLAIMTLEAIEAACRDGLLQLGERCFTEPVVAPSELRMAGGKALIGEPGTPMPTSVFDDPPTGWTPLSQEAANQIRTSVADALARAEEPPKS
jgi:hypothetical protein